jgi:hypothetical protein
MQCVTFQRTGAWNFWTIFFKDSGFGGTDQFHGLSPPAVTAAWRYLKERFVHTMVAILIELPVRITDAVASVTNQMLENT